MDQFLRDADKPGSRIQPQGRIVKNLRPLSKGPTKGKKGDEGRRAMNAKRAANLENQLHIQRGLEIEAKERHRKKQNGRRQ